MAYREDRDLEFLARLKSADLDDLVYVLTHDKDGSARLTEELTDNEDYKKMYPDHARYWQAIAAELQCFGANTFATLFRGGEGVLYAEILQDVCDRVKVKYNKNDNVEDIETALLMHILEESIRKMPENELVEFAQFAGLEVMRYTPQALLAAALAAFKIGGFASYQMATVVANTIMKLLFNRGLNLAANAALSRMLAIFTGPIGWLITALWTAIDIAGPAYRITIPAVIQVAYLRKLYDFKKLAQYPGSQCLEISGK